VSDTPVMHVVTDLHVGDDVTQEMVDWGAEAALFFTSEEGVFDPYALAISVYRTMKLRELLSDPDQQPRDHQEPSPQMRA